ncbi:MAG: hypothetical protein IJQ07_03320 [Clostridia bacterium]|nr:hypothetical protein [Clostridia bacterium]
MIIEILSVLLQIFWSVINGIAMAIYNMLPGILQINRVLTFLSPPGSVFILLGVPLVLVPSCVKVVKLISKHI